MTVNFLFVLTCVLFRYIPAAPPWLDFITSWLTFFLVFYGIYIQFDFVAAVLILANIKIQMWVPRFRMIWSLLYFIAYLPTYFVLANIGHEPNALIKGIRMYTLLVFMVLSFLYDLTQGITCIVLLSRHCKSKFNNSGKTFLDSLEECKLLFRLTMMCFTLTLTFLIIQLYLIFVDYSSRSQMFELFGFELLSMVFILYYFQMIRVSSIVLKPKVKKSHPIPIKAIHHDIDSAITNINATRIV